MSLAGPIKIIFETFLNCQQVLNREAHTIQQTQLHVPNETEVTQCENDALNLHKMAVKFCCIHRSPFKEIKTNRPALCFNINSSMVSSLQHPFQIQL